MRKLGLVEWRWKFRRLKNRPNSNWRRNGLHLGTHASNVIQMELGNKKQKREVWAGSFVIIKGKCCGQEQNEHRD